MKGFFNESDYRNNKAWNKFQTAKCGKCNLYQYCNSPKMPPSGNNHSKVLILGECPGGVEDKEGYQFRGKTGKYLRRVIKRISNLDLHTDFILDNAIRCRKTDEEENNLKPTTTEINHCRPNIQKVIRKHKPNVIIPVGECAVLSLIGARWKKNVGGITKWRGWTIPDRYYQAWICPTFHPSYVYRDATPDSAKVIFEEDLKAALAKRKEDLPWFAKRRDNDEDFVKILKHRRDIENYLQSIVLNPPALSAFDYETTGLKPQMEGHDIITCSICTTHDPYTSYSFPMFEEIRPLFKRFLVSDAIRKTAANIKFEHVWSQVILDALVKGWFHCTMNSAHILDNRPGITSLKFQAYIRYGITDYDSHISKYLEPKEGGGNDFNNIKQAPIRDLLTYGGLDSLYELWLALEQLIQFGFELPEKPEIPF